jgi:hypothetical protein
MALGEDLMHFMPGIDHFAEQYADGQSECTLQQRVHGLLTEKPVRRPPSGNNS